MNMSAKTRNVSLISVLSTSRASSRGHVLSVRVPDFVNSIQMLKRFRGPFKRVLWEVEGNGDGYVDNTWNN